VLTFAAGVQSNETLKMAAKKVKILFPLYNKKSTLLREKALLIVNLDYAIWLEPFEDLSVSGRAGNVALM